MADPSTYPARVIAKLLLIDEAELEKLTKRKIVRQVDGAYELATAVQGYIKHLLSKGEKATQQEVAEHLFMERPRVSDLIAKGVFPASGRRGLNLEDCRETYIKRLREEAAGRKGDGETDLVDERARLAKEQADKAQMENAARRGELVERADVDAAVVAAFTRVKSRLLAIPSKAAPVLLQAEDAPEAEIMIRQAVVEALTELSDPDELVASLADGEVDAGTQAAT